MNMNISQGHLVKTLSGRIVKTEKETVPGSGYWQCNDGRIHLAASFREVNAAEMELYATSQGVSYITDHIQDTNDQI